MRILKASLLLVTIVSVAACSGRGNGGKGPDEFAVVPSKPLSMPTDFTSLPAPNVGGANRVDQYPNQDAVAALGGNGSALTQTTSRASETALLNSTTRYGVDANIRATLAKEDAAIRKNGGARLLERLAGQTISERTYRSQRLDVEAELIKLRARGVRTPTVPPAE